MTRTFKAITVALAAVFVCGCQREPSVYEGTWWKYDSRMGDPLPHIVIRTNPRGTYWDGLNEVQLKWEIDGGVLRIECVDPKDLEAWSLVLDDDGSTLRDLEGNERFVGGALVQQISRVVGDWAGQDDRLVIHENGVVDWYLNDRLASDMRIFPQTNHFKLIMRVFENEFETEIRLDGNKHLIWSAANGRSTRLERVDP